MPVAPKETGVATSSAAHAKISAESEAGGGLWPSAPSKSAPGSSDIDDGTVLADLVAPRKKEKGADASVEPFASKHDYFSIEHFGFIVLDRKRKQFNAHCACRGKASPEGLAIGDSPPKDHTTATMPVCRTNVVGNKRPLGMLVQWLRQGRAFDTRKEHLDSRRIITKAERVECRAWVRAQPALLPLLQCEKEWCGGDGDVSELEVVT